MTAHIITTYYCQLCNTISNFFVMLNYKRLARNERSRCWYALNRLSDRELADIGITHGDIKFVANGGKIYRGEVK